MAKLRRSKTLERVARSIKDSDEFANHVFGIAAQYRAQHALETGVQGPTVRQALKTLQRHALALEAWLRMAQRSTTAEHEALAALSLALHGSRSTARASAAATQLWLATVTGGVERALLSVRRTRERLATRRAAEALRATFEYHGLKVSPSARNGAPSDAVRLLCAIAKDAGDRDTGEAQAVLALRSPRAKPTRSQIGDVGRPPGRP